MFKQGIEALGLSIEEGTANVPSDGRYHIVVHGDIVSSHTKPQAALERYRSIRDELIEASGHSTDFSMPTARALRKKQVAEYDAYRARVESSSSKMASTNKKGGRGKGGVGR